MRTDEILVELSAHMNEKNWSEISDLKGWEGIYLNRVHEETYRPAKAYLPGNDPFFAKFVRFIFQSVASCDRNEYGEIELDKPADFPAWSGNDPGSFANELRSWHKSSPFRYGYLPSTEFQSFMQKGNQGRPEPYDVEFLDQVKRGFWAEILTILNNMRKIIDQLDDKLRENLST